MSDKALATSPTGSETSGQDDDALDAVFHALANRRRRQILDLLRDQPRTTGDLCAQLPDIDRCTTMQHIGVLEKAGLVVAQRRGRERWNHLDVIPITMVQDRWIDDYARAAARRLAALSSDLDSTKPRVD